MTEVFTKPFIRQEPIPESAIAAAVAASGADRIVHLAGLQVSYLGRGVTHR